MKTCNLTYRYLILLLFLPSLICCQTEVNNAIANQIDATIVNKKIAVQKNTTLSDEEGIFIGSKGSYFIDDNATLTIDTKFNPFLSKKIFFGNGNVLFNTSSVDRIDVTWFGAKPNDEKSDVTAIQKAIDAAIMSSGVSVVYFPPGEYCIDAPLIAMRKKNKTNFSSKKEDFTFFNLTLLGHQLPYSNPKDKKGGVSVLKVDKEIPFALGIQGARGVHIENMVFDGYISEKLPIDELINKSSNELYPQGRFSPLSAIAIDPFSKGKPSGGGYKGLDSYYNTKTNSSRVLIENSMIQNFPTGIAISPNGMTKQGDSVAINFTRFLNLINGIVICQAQSRNIVVDNCSFHRMKFAFNSDDFGEQQGVLPEVNNSKIADGVAWIYKANGNVAYGHFNNVYAESLYGIGYSKVNKQPLNFNSCVFKFRPHIDPLKKYVNPCLIKADNALFIGCTLTYGKGKKNIEPLLINVKKATFINSYLDSEPINIGKSLTDKNSTNLLDSNFRKIKKVSSKWNKKQFSNINNIPFSSEGNNLYSIKNNNTYKVGDFIFGLMKLNQEPFEGKLTHTVIGKVTKLKGGKVYFESNTLSQVKSNSIKVLL